MLIISYFASILLTCALSGFLACYAWQQRGVPGSRAYAGLVLGECLLALTEMLSMLNPTPAGALFWFQVRYLSLAVIPVFWLVFALEYSGRKAWLSKRLLAGLFIVPVIAQLLLWTNSLHGLWAKHDVSLHQNGLFWIADTSARLPGIGFLAHSLYALMLLLAGIGLLLTTAWRLRCQFRGQALLVAGAGFTAFVLAINSIFNLIPQTEFNLFTPGIGLSVLLIALAVFRFQFLKRTPAAHARSEALEVQSQRSLAVFLLIFGIMAAGIGAIAYVSYQDYEQQFRNQAERQLAGIAELKVDELQGWREERLAHAKLLYRNPAFSALVQRYLDDPTNAQAQRELHVWLDRFQAYEQYVRVSLLDEGGNERLSAPPPPKPVAASLSQEAAATMNTGQVTFLDFHRDDLNGAIYLALLVPIIAEQEGNRPLGILVLHIDPHVFLYPYIQQWPVPSTSAETLLVRREGSDALFLNELRFQTNSALNLRVPLANTQVLAVKAALGQEGLVEGLDYRGVPAIAAVRAVPGSPWFLVARADTAEIYAPLRERWWQTAAFFGALMVAFGATLALVWRQQRVRHYRRQVEAAQALHESLERFQLANRATFNSIWDWNLRTDALWWNENFQTLTGNSIEEIQPCIESWTSRIHPQDVDRVKTEIRRAIDSGRESWFDRYRFRRGDGQYAEIEDRGCISRDASGKPVRMIGAMQDITERVRVEAALHASEVRYRRLFEAAKDGIAILDADTGMIMDANPFLVERLGVSREQILQKKIWELGFFKDIVGNQAYFAELQQKEYVHYEDKPLETADGQRIEVEFVSYVYEVNHQKVVQCNIRDITERKRAEAERARLLNVLEASLNEIYIFAPDTLKFQYVNAGAVHNLGYSPEHLKTLTPLDLKPEFTATSFRELIAPLFRCDKDEIVFQTVHRRADASLYPVEVHLQLVASAGVRVFVAIILDITERTHAEAALRESEDKFKYVFDHSVIGKSITLPSGEINVNRALCDMLGYPPDGLENRRWQDITHPDDIELTQRTVDLLLSGKQDSVKFTKRYIHKGGAVVWADVSTSLRRDKEGKPLYFVTAIIDITERKRQEAAILAAHAEMQRLLDEADQSRRALLSVVEDQKAAEEEILRLNAELEQRVRDRTAQLQTANQELEAFSYSVSHDLRAPLRAVIGFSAAVLEDYGSHLDGEGQRLLTTIRDEADKMGQLIDDLLAFSRIGRQVMATTTIDMTALARSVLDELATEAARTVEIRLDPLPPVCGDRSMLRQVWVNLLSNARKFTQRQEKAVIHVGATESHGELVIFFVRDNGSGFDMRYAHKLFGVFQRLHSESEFEGTGIGLSIVQRVILRHGGRVWAEGQVNQGATFYFALPKRVNP